MIKKTLAVYSLSTLASAYVREDTNGWLIQDLSENEWSPAFKDEILKRHNQARSELATGVMFPDVYSLNTKKLYWDDELAKHAQEWANSCYFEHDANYLNTLLQGENLGVVSTGGSWNPTKESSWVNKLNAPFNGWKNEKEYFTQSNTNLSNPSYTNYQSAPSYTVGHFTAAMWYETDRIGCGAAYCDAVDGLGFPWPAAPGGNNAIHLVCRYQKRGNISGKKFFARTFDADKIGAQCEYGVAEGLCLSKEETEALAAADNTSENDIVEDSLVTEAPATEAPATQAPETEAPETEAPETEAPETEAPETEAPATQAPETEVVPDTSDFDSYLQDIINLEQPVQFVTESNQVLGINHPKDDFANNYMIIPLDFEENDIQTQYYIRVREDNYLSFPFFYHLKKSWNIKKGNDYQIGLYKDRSTSENVHDGDNNKFELRQWGNTMKFNVYSPRYGTCVTLTGVEGIRLEDCDSSDMNQVFALRVLEEVLGLHTSYNTKHYDLPFSFLN